MKLKTTVMLVGQVSTPPLIAALMQACAYPTSFAAAALVPPHSSMPGGIALHESLHLRHAEAVTRLHAHEHELPCAHRHLQFLMQCTRNCRLSRHDGLTWFGCNPMGKSFYLFFCICSCGAT